MGCRRFIIKSLSVALTIIEGEPNASNIFLFSSAGRSPGRAIVLPPALVAASALAKC